MGILKTIGGMFGARSGGYEEQFVPAYSDDGFALKCYQYNSRNSVPARTHEDGYTDWVNHALQPALKAGDMDFVRQAVHHDKFSPTSTKSGSEEANPYVQHALAEAVLGKNTEAVRLFLEAGVDPEDQEVLSHDAIFVSALGYIPEDFSGPNWQSDMSTTDADREIFKMLFEAVQEKYGDDRLGFVKAMHRGHEKDNPTIGWGAFGAYPEPGTGGFRQGTTLLGGAREGIQDVIEGLDPELWSNRDRINQYIWDLGTESRENDAVVPS